MILVRDKYSSTPNFICCSIYSGVAIGDAIGGAICDAIGGAIGGAICDAIGDAIGGAIGDAIGDAMGGAIGDAICRSTCRGAARSSATSIIKQISLSFFNSE